MKFFVRSVLFVLAAYSSVLSGQTLPADPQISATGRGDVKIKPTRASLNFTVQGKGETASLAAARNAQVVAATFRSLVASGVRPENMSNTTFNVSPDFEFSAGTRKPVGFVASNGIRVERISIEDVGKTIDAGLAGGATQVASAQYSGDGTDEARRSALKVAVEQARRDAEAMAAAAGGALGRLLFMTSAASSGIGERLVELNASVSVTGAAETNIRAADLTVSATATGRWEFIPRK